MMSRTGMPETQCTALFGENLRFISKLLTNLLSAYGGTSEENLVVVIIRLLTKQDTSFEVKKICGIYSTTFCSEKRVLSSPSSV